MAYKLTGQLRSKVKLRTRPIHFFSVAHQHTALLTLPDRSMPPIAMEADAVHQGCLLFCELHSRSLAVGCTAIQLLAHAILRLRTRGLRNLGIAQMCYAILGFRECATQSRDLKIAHTWFTQSRDCANVLRNLGIPRMRNAISGLRKFPNCAEHIHSYTKDRKISCF